MAYEIERKFLVKNDSFKKEAFTHTAIRQGYLSTIPERVVRIRTKGDVAFLTIKSCATDGGFSRYEWEREIPVDDALDMLAFCEYSIIEKTRYLIQVESHLFEVDIFSGANEGLIIAEVELSSEEEFFEKPEWLGREVTYDVRYYNSSLSKNPYTKWSD